MPRLFYCFVDFGDGFDDTTRTYVIPSSVVARVLSLSHEHWVKTPGKGGRERSKDSDMRRFKPDYTKTFGPTHPLSRDYGPGWIDRYQNAWDQLRELEEATGRRSAAAKA